MLLPSTAHQKPTMPLRGAPNGCRRVFGASIRVLQVRLRQTALLVCLLLFAPASAPANAQAAATLNSLSVLASPEEMPAEIRVGLQSTLDPEFLVESFATTMRRLRSLYPKTVFRTTLYSAAELADVVENRKVDIFFADGALFSLLSLEHGAQQLASRVSPYAEDPTKAASFTIVVPMESTIRTLADLRGKRIAAEDRSDFSTWQLFEGLMTKEKLADEDWDRNAVFTKFAFPDPILLAQEGRADAAVIKACTYEKMIGTRAIEPGAFRVVNFQPAVAGFPCRRSAPLFPDVVMGIAKGVDAKTTSALAVAVLTAPKSRGGYYWRIASDFSSVRDLYRTLGIGPYRYLKTTTFEALWNTYKTPILAVLATILLLALHSLVSNIQVERRTRALRLALAEKDKAAREARLARERLAEMERAGVVAGLSSMFAHEVRQPLATLCAYADGLRLGFSSLLSRLTQTPNPQAGASARRSRPAGTRISEADLKHSLEAMAAAAGHLSDSAERVSAIVERVRGYAKSRAHPHVPMPAADIVDKALATFSQSSLSEGIQIVRTSERNAADTIVAVEPLEMELAVVNLLRNAAAAMREAQSTERKIDISIRRSAPPANTPSVTNESVEIVVRDTGDGIHPVDEAVFMRLAQPMKSSKAEGLGLGRSIVKRIMEAHGGSLRFERSDRPGLTAVLKLPAAGFSSDARSGELQNDSKSQTHG